MTANAPARLPGPYAATWSPVALTEMSNRAALPTAVMGKTATATATTTVSMRVRRNRPEPNMRERNCSGLGTAEWVEGAGWCGRTLALVLVGDSL